MLGVLCLASKRRFLFASVRAEYQKIGDEDALWVTIPSPRPRFLKRAARQLSGLRVLVPDELSRVVPFSKWGICAVMPGEIFERLAASLVRTVMHEKGLSPAKTVLTVFGGTLGELGEQMLWRLSREVRYLSLRCFDERERSRSLLETCGVITLRYPPSRTDYPTQIILEPERERLRMTLLCRDEEKELADMEIRLPERYAAVPKTHRKSAACAFLQSGKLQEKEILIESVHFHG